MISTKTISPSIIALIHWIGISFIFHFLLKDKLNMDAIEMSHLDPSEIIAKLFDIHIIIQIVSSSFFLSLPMTCGLIYTIQNKIRNDPTIRRHQQDMPTKHSSIWQVFQTIIKMLGLYILSALFVFLSCILCGVTPNSYSMIVLTFGGSCFISGIGLSPIWMFWTMQTFPFSFSSTESMTKLILYFILAIPFQNDMYHDIQPIPSTHGSKNNTDEIGDTCMTPLTDMTAIMDNNATKKHGYSLSMSPYLCIPTILSYCTLLGIICSMILLPLDHGAQIQRWPIPMLLGTWIGYGVGVILSTLWEYFGLYIMMFVHGVENKIKA